MIQNQAKTDLKKLIESVLERSGPVVCDNLSGAESAWSTWRLYRDGGVSVVVICADPRKARQMHDDLQFFAGGNQKRIWRFPAYNVQPFRAVGYHRQTAAERIATLHHLLASGQPSLVVTTVEALARPIIPKQRLLAYVDLIMQGERLDLDQLTQRLISGGYTRTSLVEEPGDFSVRGGIIDLFTPQHTQPVRIELFGDLVDSLRIFSVTSQRTLSVIDETVVLPASEAILTPSQSAPVLARLRLRCVEQGLPVTVARQWTERLQEETFSVHFEGLLPIVYERPGSLLDYFPPGTLPMVVDPAEVTGSHEKMVAAFETGHDAALADQRLCLTASQMVMTWADITDQLTRLNAVHLRPLAVGAPAAEQPSTHTHLQVDVRETATLKNRLFTSGENGRPQHSLQPLTAWIQANSAQSIDTLLVCQTATRVARLEKMLAGYGLVTHRLTDIDVLSHPAGTCHLAQGSLSSGFIWPAAGVALVTESDIFNVKAVPHRHPAPPPPQALALEDLQIGDLVVHDDHGIGRYEGLATLEVDVGGGDFLSLAYRDDDRLYLPVERMGIIQKYMGMEGVTPQLDKMGGLSWERVKTKIKRSAERIAGELLKIYAERKAGSGVSFTERGPSYDTFVAGFDYDETPDQTRAIRDVLADMARPAPMDRLICGDVGYGKTEVALRAAYVAVSNARQVAMIVPTTVLAEQHFETFRRRFDDTPFNVACLSRFRSPRHQREIIKRMAAGQVDIVVGTHRIFSKDVRFQALGLVILDEEQRFGVRHKERLKKLRRTVDVLALTATPIPRTLHLSLTGIRDISTISTPPELRQPIVTYVCELDEALLKDAIEREIARAGQVYFVHNHIQSIERMAARIQRLVPAVKLDIAHGQMSEEQLEETMRRFVSKEIDLLVCTTIIESGIDVASANTMLINRADRLGLAQIYQLRGRVGRSSDQAFAYLFIPTESTLTRTARKRLKVLMEHSDLGSGYQIALNDLKIRGGGTILGAAQSGHIAAVGYDMYLKLMQTAVAELKGEPTTPPLEPEINIAFTAVIPENYVGDIDQRLILYRRLTRLCSTRQISAFKQELIDRFGPLPPATTNLLIKMMLRLLAIDVGIERIDLPNGDILMQFSMAHLRAPEAIMAFANQDPRRRRFKAPNILQVQLTPGNLPNRLKQAKNILKEIQGHVNS